MMVMPEDERYPTPAAGRLSDEEVERLVTIGPAPEPNPAEAAAAESAEDTPADGEPAADDAFIEDEFGLTRPRPPFQPESQTEEQIAEAAAEAARVAAEEAQLAQERLEIHVRSRSQEELSATSRAVSEYSRLGGQQKVEAWDRLSAEDRAVYERVFDIREPFRISAEIIDGTDNEKE